MPYLPPAVLGLLAALGAFCGLAMLVGIRLRWSSQLEPLSRQARWLVVGALAVLAVGGYVAYRLAMKVLDT